jgi:predicted nucleic acid-binding protein
MAARVVDASALAALLFGEPKAQAVARCLEGQRLFAPELLIFELANVCRRKIGAHPESVQPIRAAFDLADRLPIERVVVVHAEVLSMALDTKLSTYDASYLWMARELKAEFITLDDKLRSAAKKHRVKVRQL